MPDGTEANDWIVGNIKQNGFYRVNYDNVSWSLLVQQLNDNNDLIDATSRAQLIDDSFNLGRAEIIEQTKFLDVISYLEHETDPLPILNAINGLDYIHMMISNDFETLNLYKVFIFELINLYFQCFKYHFFINLGFY